MKPWGGDYHFRLWPFFVTFNEGAWPFNFTVGDIGGGSYRHLKGNEFKWVRGPFHWYVSIRFLGKDYRWHSGR